MSNPKKDWNQLGQIEAAKRGYDERTDRKVKYDHGQDALRQAQARSRIEDIRLAKMAEPGEVWD